jgi:hypothetical protein
VAENEPLELRFGGGVPVIAIVFEFERPPLIVGSMDDDSTFAIGRWLADKPEWFELLTQALALYAEET